MTQAQQRELKRDERRDKNRPKLVSAYIKRNKYLSDPKYFKNNYWSLAAWDSWAATGKVGGCGICGVGHYNATLHNSRKNTDKGGKKAWLPEASKHLCYKCREEIERQLETEFKKQ